MMSAVRHEAREVRVVIDDDEGMTSLYLARHDGTNSGTAGALDAQDFYLALSRSTGDDRIHCELDDQATGFFSGSLRYEIGGRRVVLALSGHESFDAARGVTEIDVEIPPEVADMDEVAACLAHLFRPPAASDGDAGLSSWDGDTSSRKSTGRQSTGRQSTGRRTSAVLTTAGGTTEIGPGSRRGAAGRGTRIVGACIIGGLVVLTPLIVKCAATPRQGSVRAAADGAAYDLERKPVDGLIVSIFDVQDAVAHNARDSRGRSYASELKVTDKGHDSRGDLYEVTNSGGDYPVCLIVNVDDSDLISDTPTYPTTSVTDGHC